ncbi:MAG TPA: hypothetical protein VMB79_03350, partial [Jatrophihabitans sp.]|nr:hypothetical protein [Jatrophihabitans sp.]
MTPADGRSYPTNPRHTKVVRKNSPTVTEVLPNVRVLDPSTALRVPGQQPPQPTVYIGDALLLRQVPDGTDTIAALQAAAAEHNLVVTVSPAEQQLVDLARRLGISEQDAQPLLSRVHLTPDESADQAAPPPDAWQVLQTFRSAQRADAGVANQVHLDHLLAATARIGGVPLTSGHGIDGVPL